MTTTLFVYATLHAHKSINRSCKEFSAHSQCDDCAGEAGGGGARARSTNGHHNPLGRRTSSMKEFSSVCAKKTV